MSVYDLILTHLIKLKGLNCLNWNFRDVIEMLINMRGPKMISNFSLYSKFYELKTMVLMLL